MNRMYEESHIQNIANAIRDKGVTGNFTVAQMAPAIENISTGGTLNKGFILNDEDRSITFYGNFYSSKLSTPYQYSSLSFSNSGVLNLLNFRGINSIRGLGNNKYHLGNFGVVEIVDNDFDFNLVRYPFEQILIIDTLDLANYFVNSYGGSSLLHVFFRNIANVEYLFDGGYVSESYKSCFANFSPNYTKVIDMGGLVVDMRTGLRPMFPSPVRGDSYLRLENMRILANNLAKTNLSFIDNATRQGVSFSYIYNIPNNIFYSLGYGSYNGTLIVESGCSLNNIRISAYYADYSTVYEDYNLDIDNYLLYPSNSHPLLKPWKFNNIVLNGDFYVKNRFIELPTETARRTIQENEVIKSEIIAMNGTYNNLKNSQVWPPMPGMSNYIKDITDEFIEDISVTVNYDDGIESFSRTYECDRYMVINYNKVSNVGWNIPYINARENKLLPWFIYHVKE